MEDRCPEGAIFAHQWIIKAIFFLKQRKIILIFFSLASKTFNQYSLDNLHIFSNYSIIFEHFKRVHSSCTCLQSTDSPTLLQEDEYEAGCRGTKKSKHKQTSFGLNLNEQMNLNQLLQGYSVVT